METVRALADRFHGTWLATHPLTATRLGVDEYDDRVPDDSEEGAERRRGELVAALSAAAALEPGAEGEDAVTLDCLRSVATGELDALEAAALEHTVSPMPHFGPGLLLATAARTILADDRAAEAYLLRLERAGAWIDQQAARLVAGAARGRVPVGLALDQTIAWGEAVLGAPVPRALLAPDPPAHWSGAETWRAAREHAAVKVVRPALVRYLATLRELRPVARPAERCGLVHLPGGEEDYARAIRFHTTLSLKPDELHAMGRDEVARLEQRCLELARRIGVADLETLHATMRAAASSPRTADTLHAARAAVRRAEARVGEVIPPPLPLPCAVEEMPPDAAASGSAPHYSPPRLDGTRGGTYWFNTLRPTAGTGFDLESVAFHEAVPGHHLQLARSQLLTDVPALRRQRPIAAHAEGWGLYAEQLAEEMDLYSSTESLLGACATALMRAARLVVDTGIHAHGWSRDEALSFLVAHVPMPESFLADEIDRYIAWPGQALTYQVGKFTILELRDAARGALGERFDLRAFHAALLNSGSLPLPVLRQVVTDALGLSSRRSVVGERRTWAGRP